MRFGSGVNKLPPANAITALPLDAIPVPRPLLENGRASKPLVLVYVGENKFPDSEKQLSFFVYPYSQRGGLELNTMPPRFHRAMLEQYELLKPVDQPSFKFATAANYHGLTIDWLKSPRIAGDHFLRSSRWQPGGSYRILRAKPPFVYRQSTGNLTRDGLEHFTFACSV
jgi:hypothetical protein